MPAGDRVATLPAYEPDGAGPAPALYPTTCLRSQLAKYGPYDIDATGKVSVD